MRVAEAGRGGGSGCIQRTLLAMLQPLMHPSLRAVQRRHADLPGVRMHPLQAGRHAQAFQHHQGTVAPGAVQTARLPAGMDCTHPSICPWVTPAGTARSWSCVHAAARARAWGLGRVSFHAWAGTTGLHACWLAVVCVQVSRMGLDDLNLRFLKESYMLASEPGPLAQGGFNNTHFDFIWNVGLVVSPPATH